MFKRIAQAIGFLSEAHPEPLGDKEALFGNDELSEFWNNTEWAMGEYVGRPVTTEMIKRVETELGYRLPASYLELMQNQNGGTPNHVSHKTRERTSWAEDHIAITGIYGLDRVKRYSLCGEIGSEFWIEEWGYPEIGVYVCDCPSAGHDMICLDYRDCGPTGEPQVVHVDQEDDYRITHVADNFGDFIQGLQPSEDFD